MSLKERRKRVQPQAKGRVQKEKRKPKQLQEDDKNSLRQMKIAIVGSKPDTWEKVPELGKEWEVWRFSRRTYKQRQDYHRWFELHPPTEYRKYSVVPGYVEFIGTDKRVVLHHQFPFQRLLDEFGPYFFSGGQIPWLMAYAITLNPQTIGIWGVDPIGDYKPQRSEVQHFVQVARDRGIEVIAPEETFLEPRSFYAFVSSNDKAVGAVSPRD